MKTLKSIYQQAMLMVTALGTLSACQSTSQERTAADSTNHKIKPGKISKRTQDGCYMHVSGQQMKDTLYVQLHIQNNEVSGRMENEIYEKDSRKGTLKGTIQPDNTIKAVWTFMQEGTTDTMTVAFKLNHTGLMQMPLKADMGTGRQVTDASAGYNIELKPTDCNKG